MKAGDAMQRSPTADIMRQRFHVETCLLLAIAHLFGASWVISKASDGG